MVSGVTHNALRYSLLLSTSLIISPMAVASEDALDKGAPRIERVDKGKNNEASRLLEGIFKKAGEQGFITYDAPKNTVEKTPLQSPEVDEKGGNEERSLMPSLSADGKVISCFATSVLDYDIYQSVSSYTDITAAKSQIKKNENFEDIFDLAKTYLSLGMGAEATDLTARYGIERAHLMAAMGRVISQYPTAEDQDLLQRYYDCNNNAKFWALVGQASSEPFKAPEFTIPLTQGLLDILRQLPPELKALTTSRLAIFQAELGNVKIAERMLVQIEPETSYGTLPKIKTDDRLYLFAMVREAKEDPKASQIFKHLGQYDGLYRIRALEKLAEGNHGADGHPYAEFSDDLKAVSQQYNGRSQSRIATLQVMQHRVEKGQFIDAIETTMREFKRIDSEFEKAVSLIGDHIEKGLNAQKKTTQIYALNGYMYDPKFFDTYSKISALRTLAVDTAISLDLPELAKHLPKTSDVKQLAYADAKSSFKSGQYDAAIGIATPYTSDTKFNDLIIEASIQSGNREAALKALRRMPSDNSRFAKQVEMAWQKGNWGEAKNALEALAHNDPNEEIKDKITILDFVIKNPKLYSNPSVPNNAEEMDGLMEQLGRDAAIVKGYLKNG